MTTVQDIVDDESQIAPTRRSTPGPDGGIVPGRLAGYVWDGAAYCPECAADVDVPAPADDPRETIKMDKYPAFETDPNGFGVGTISGFDEWDAPGATCHECHRVLQTNIITYD
jgi:hypothetical protein